MYCNKCGKQIEDTASFCNACGTAIKPTGKVQDIASQQFGMGKIIFRYKKNVLLYWNLSGPLEIILNNGIMLYVPENKEIVYDAPIGNYFMIASVKTFVGIKAGVVNKSFTLNPNQTYVITYKPPIWFSGRLTIEMTN